MTRPINLHVCWLLLITTASPAFPWWDTGHVLIAEIALIQLPPDVPEFLKEQKATLTYMSTEPDNWRKYGDALRLAEGPNHYLDLETIDKHVEAVTPLSDRYSAIFSYQAKGDSVQHVGLLPYQILEYYQRLKGEFKRYRERTVDQKAIEAAIVVYAGLMSHYVGDVSQPLHTTIHFNGRVNERREVIAQKGIHSRFEGPFVERYIHVADCLKFVDAPRVCADPSAEVMKAILASHRLVDTVYQLDATGKLDQPDQETIEFVQRRIAAGAQLLVDLWYTAWVESGK
ncbi:MAG: hypothetical protein HY709_03750 [Candidatus Latescibacteria bacterium]|nr:hypothetical protein [Candidatus Latescibacterota bacterium]